MTTEYAFRLFGLAPLSSDQEISERYRTLVREYHPDKTSHSTEVAHIMMTKINEAHDIIKNYAARSRTNEGEKDSPTTVEEYAASTQQSERDSTATVRGDATVHDTTQQSENRDVLRGAVSEYPLRLHNSYREYTARLIDIIRYYYQFGLNNTQIRLRGSGRLHYSGACDKLHRLIQAIRRTLHVRTAAEHDGARSLENLAVAFYENMKIDLFIQPSVHKALYKEYRKYSTASQVVDTVVSSWYGSQSTNRKPPSFDIYNYDMAYKLLTVIIATKFDTAITAASEVKIVLLEQFLCSRFFEFYA